MRIGLKMSIAGLNIGVNELGNSRFQGRDGEQNLHLPLTLPWTKIKKINEKWKKKHKIPFLLYPSTFSPF